MTEYKEKGVETCPKYGNDTITWRRTSKMNVLGLWFVQVAVINGYNCLLWIPKMHNDICFALVRVL